MPGPTPTTPTVLTPSAVTHFLATAVQQQFADREVEIEGEIVDLVDTKSSPTFTLADHHARLPARFAGAEAASRVKAQLALTGHPLKNGLLVKAHARLAVQESTGRPRLLVTEIDPASARPGPRRAQKRALAESLVESGDAGNQSALTLSETPLRLAIVGPQGQGYEDVLAVLRRSPWDWSVRSVLVTTTGPGAPGSVAKGILAAQRHEPDAILLTRGGGEALDEVFSHPTVVGAITGCQVPVLTAIGHEGDHSLADGLAYKSFPTPTAAATWLVERVARLDREIGGLLEELAGVWEIELTRQETLLDDPSR